MRPIHFATLVALSMLWGSAFMMVEVAQEAVPTLTLVAGRMVAALGFLAIALVVTGRSLGRDRKLWLPFVIMGLANNVWPFTLLTWGQEHIEGSLAAILAASMTLSTAVLAHFWLGERLTVGRSVGLLVGFAGVFVLIGGDLRDVTSSSTLGQLAVIAGVLGYSFGIVYARRYLTTADPAVTATGQLLVAAAFMAPIALAVDRPFDLELSTKEALAWASLGVMSSAVAYLLFFWVIRHVTATQASMVAYMIPVVALFLGVVVLDERLAMTSFIGLALIVAGVWIVTGGGRWLSDRVASGRAPVAVSGGADGE